MAQNRNILFGYQMSEGVIKAHPHEKEIVEEIFTEYAKGLSYKSIAEELTQRRITYLPEKTTWNKNMIARILQNEQYKGQDKYPLLISEELFLAAQSSMKPYTKTVSPEIKEIKPLIFCGVCGAEVERKWIVSNKERWKCPNDVNHISTHCSDKLLLDQVWKLKDESRCLSGSQFENKQIDLDLIRTEQALKENDQLSRGEKTAQLFELAQKRYNQCQSREVPQISQEEWIGNILKINVTQSIVTEIILNDGKTIRNE